LLGHGCIRAAGTAALFGRRVGHNSGVNLEFRADAAIRYEDCMDARIVDGAALPVYDLGQDHPFARDRQRPLFDLLTSSGLLQEGDLLPVRPATMAELQLAHDPAYLEMLRATSAPHPDRDVLRRAPMFGLGTPDNPISAGQFDAAAAIAGATLGCVEAVLQGAARAAFNPAGGLHHAMPFAAAGFCLVNDLVLAIKAAQRAGIGRVLYVDYDVHHGDGVEFAFRADPSVLTISLHETPEVRYPGTGTVSDQGEGKGFGYAVNVPLQPGTDDASWIECVERVVVPLGRRFRPDLIVSQHGCDAHRDDPLATLDCTTRSFWTAAQQTRALADEVCGGRWVATGGGGYRPYSVIPRAFGMVWAAMAGRALPEAIDPRWITRWQARAGAPLPATWLDAATAPQPAVAAANRRTVDSLLQRIPWLQ
jgi:acetoin utilization protein AcuC